MIHVRFQLTWPALILVLIALLLWLTRDPARPARAARPQQRPATPPRPTRRQRDCAGRDYATETRRLDDEAAAAGQAAFEQPIIIDMPEPTWRNKS